MAGRMDGKVALVTGAGSGIGRATALAFARKSTRVVVVNDMVENVEETVRMIRETGGEALFVKADVSKAAEVEAMVNEAVNAYDGLDFAHNNAGIEGDMVPRRPNARRRTGIAPSPPIRRACDCA
ncbi:MAG: SDR family NAD(P)-dependent oxidoreductase [Chlorobiaceae bacterium]|nr:SDR family NAD(P)-dependent oxidoreductase [Chlorobiaceae bacterium]